MIRFVRFREQDEFYDNEIPNATYPTTSTPTRPQEPIDPMLSASPEPVCTPVDEPKISSAIDQINENHVSYLDRLGLICSYASKDYLLPDDYESQLRACCSYDEELSMDACIDKAINSITLQFIESFKCNTSSGPDTSETCCALKPEFEDACDLLERDLGALFNNDIRQYSILAESCKWDLETANLRCREMNDTLAQIDEKILENIHEQFQVELIHCDLAEHFVSNLYEFVKQTLSSICDVGPNGKPVVPPANVFELTR